MRCIAVLAVLIGVEVVGGIPTESDLSNPASTVSPTTTTQEYLPNNTTTSTTSSLSATSTPLFLPVTASPPDPLGISQVSGFYGPGAWAAWFLTVVASWIRIFRRSKEKVDINTTLFLLGTNWAAVDIFRGIHALRSLQPDQPDYQTSFTKGMGNYGAAFGVVFWGTFHSFLQISFTGIAFSGMKNRSRRLWILLVGLVVPLIALTATLFGPALWGLGAPNLLPALYWKGMTDRTHNILVILAAGTAIILVIPFFFFIYMADESQFPARFRRIINAIKIRHANWRAARFIFAFYAWGSVISWLVSLVMCIVTINDTWLWGMAPFCLLLSPLTLITSTFMWVLYIPGSAVVYIFKGYLHIGSNVSESCFFMPCSPQSITDEDQMYALLAGLFSFFGFEVLPSVSKELRKRWKDKRLFVQDLEGRMREFEMRRRTAAAP